MLPKRACSGMQVALSGAASVLLKPVRPEGRGNAGAVESVENQTAVSHASHRPLEISQRRRDSHISTAPACAGWKSGKPKPGFPLFHAAQAMMTTAAVSNPKFEERKSAATRPPHSSSVLTRSPDFMLILRLENALASYQGMTLVMPKAKHTIYTGRA